MAVFNADAGPSPNCCAVLVQIEHCAIVLLLTNNRIVKINNTHLTFMFTFFSTAKIQPNFLVNAFASF